MKLTATNNVNTTKQGRRHTHNAKDAKTLHEKRGTGVGVAEVGGWYRNSSYIEKVKVRKNRNIK